MSQPQAQVTPRSVSWRIHGLDIAGLSWGDPGGRPVLALHGWLDNAASYIPLAPLLTGCHVVALDLTGHGRSDHRSNDASYQIWDDLPEILGVVDALGWNTFELIGHSRGAIISTLFAAAYPERVTHLVLIDAVMPGPVAEEDFPRQMRSALEDKMSLPSRESKRINSIETAVEVRIRSGLDEPAARLLAERNLEPYRGGFRWSTDPRLKGASAVKLSPGQIDAVLSSLSMPTLLLHAAQATFRAPELMARVRRQIPRLTEAEFAGGHHFHMEGDVAAIAARILAFMDESED
ncbi:MAG: alpha/beta hydrolase [Halioglobus sp.]|nr:alpha/beta hydrolase [Halioglobus sp.]